MSIIGVIIEGNKDATELKKLFNAHAENQRGPCRKNGCALPFNVSPTQKKDRLLIQVPNLSDEQALKLITETTETIRAENPNLPAFKSVLLENGWQDLQHLKYDDIT